MGISLARPAKGSVAWFDDVDGNWAKLEEEYLARLKSDTDEATVSNTTSETALMANTVIPANALAVGTVLSVWSHGYVIIPADSTPSVTFRFRWGGISGTELGASWAWNFGSNPSAYVMPWNTEFRLVGVSTGATGSVEVSGRFGMFTSFQVGHFPSAITIDTTGDATLLWTAQPSLTTVTVIQRTMVTNIA